MIQRKNPTLSCADAGPLIAAISPNPALQQARDGKMGSQLAKLCQENQLTYTACRHAVVRFAHQPMQP